MPITPLQASNVLQCARGLIGKTYSDLDCSHFVCEAYSKAQLDYDYADTSSFAAACAGRYGPFKPVIGDRQAADVLLFKGHMGLWDPEGCTILGTNTECKRLKNEAPLLSSRSGGNRGPDFGQPKWWGSFSVYRWDGYVPGGIAVKDLRVGQIVQPLRTITPARIAHWKYSKECGFVGGGLTNVTQLKIVETSTAPGAAWVKVQIPGSSPPRYLKIAGEEYAHNFRPR